ncbi:MAG: hypothetical protein HY744_24770 [Deltaproteobacteria bacterium]|nr:hypothetical protein [Deltaproteobacteria bacterium]
MTKTVPKAVGLLAATAALLLAPAARAEAEARAETAPSGEPGYAYVFPDDPLAAGVPGASGAVIHVISPSVRRTLIRPRLHFVAELVKSVERI